MIHVPIRPSAPLRLRQRTKHIMWLAWRMLTRREEASDGRFERRNVGREIDARRCASLLLIGFGARPDPMRPAHGSGERNKPNERAASERRGSRDARHGPLTEEIAKGVREVTHHLTNGHATPTPLRIGRERPKSTDDL